MRDFKITSMISDQIALHEVQLPLYYIHFEITHFFESVLVHMAGL